MCCNSLLENYHISPVEPVFHGPSLSAKKQKTPITQMLFLAQIVRNKLSKEASRPEYELRVLVGHANLLDSLILYFENVEQNLERYPEKTSVRDINMSQKVPERTQSTDTIVEESEDDDCTEDAVESDTEGDESDYEDILNDIAIVGMEKELHEASITARDGISECV